MRCAAARFADTDFVVGIVAVLHAGRATPIWSMRCIGWQQENVPAKLLVVGAVRRKTPRRKVSQLAWTPSPDAGYRDAAYRRDGLFSIAVDGKRSDLPAAASAGHEGSVIATAVSSLPGVVVHQTTGLWIAPGPDALCRANLGASTPCRGTDGERVRTHANFTFERMVDRTEAV
jgi:hypothetical protein